MKVLAIATLKSFLLFKQALSLDLRKSSDFEDWDGDYGSVTCYKPNDVYQRIALRCEKTMLRTKHLIIHIQSLFM